MKGTVKIDLLEYLEGKISLEEIIKKCKDSNADIEFTNPYAFRTRKVKADDLKLVELGIRCREESIMIVKIDHPEGAAKEAKYSPIDEDGRKRILGTRNRNN